MTLIQNLMNILSFGFIFYFEGIINADGEVWEAQRKFTIKTLRYTCKIYHSYTQI